MPTDAFDVRLGVIDESDALADLMWAVRQQNLDSIPRGIHPREDMRRWMREVVFATKQVWVAQREANPVALLVLGSPDWLDHLYIDASATGRGLGTTLVDLAKRELGGQLQLWTFQSNVGACRFYERHGFQAVQRTDGDNEEKAPDVRYLFMPDTH